MSFNIRNIREISNDPLTKFVNQLAKNLAKSITERQTEKLENKEDIYSDGQDLETVLRFNTLGSTHSFDGATEYYPTFEPDGEFNTLWIKGINLGNSARDFSEFDNVSTINGDPALIDGTPFDLGIMAGGVKSTALKFNRPTSAFQNEEDIRIADTLNIDVIGTAVGISYFVRFRLHSLAQQGGTNIRLFEKSDDNDYVTDPRDGVMLSISNSGIMTVTFMRADVKTEKSANSNPLSTNTVYELWITRNQGTGEVKMYLNNTELTLSNTTLNMAWHTPKTDTDLCIMGRGGTVTSGHTYGDLYDFMIYREKIISSAEKGFHFTNKWTIYDVPFGQCMISNYWATDVLDALQAYTTAGYTSTGYNT